MIKVKNLTRVYTKGSVETHALRGVTVEIESGEFIAIIGKSGAGKSTFMYQMSLLDTPTSGAISVNGTDILTLPERNRTRFRLENLGYVFQDYALLPEMTAEENVMIPLLMRGVPTETARAKARKVLGRLGLEQRVDWRPNRLSGGEQQRVSVARGIVDDPIILFADEPTANLDSATSEELMKYLRELNAAGQTIIMVTHEREYANQADRILEMSDGLIVKEHVHKGGLRS